MRRGAIAIAAIVALGLAGYASWRVSRDPQAPSDPAPRSDPRREGPSPTSTPPEADGLVRSPADEVSSGPSGPRTPPRAPDARSDDEPDPPSPELADSLDPDARRRAQAVYDEAMRDLESMEAPTEGELTEVYLRAATALERVEDELDPDDADGWKKYRSDLEALRARTRELSPAG